MILLPAGLAVANAARYPAKAGSTGYDTNGNLLLALSTTSVNGLSSSTARAAASYDYHLEKKPMRHLSPVMRSRINSTSEVVDGDYTIDDHFNIKSADGAVDTKPVLWRYTVLPVSNGFSLYYKINGQRSHMVSTAACRCQE